MRLEWSGGIVAQAFSAEDPDSLRGPQFAAAWLDEVSKWRYPDAAFDMLQFGLRLGERPRQVVTTTPRPIPLLKRLLADANRTTAVSRATTADNADHLAPHFLSRIVARYEGTRLGRQELLGEMIEDRADALWQRGAIEAALEKYTPLPMLLSSSMSSEIALNAAYDRIQPLSIDYAVMEGAARDHKVVMAALDVGWSDLGGWPALMAALGHPCHGGVVAPGTSADTTEDDLLVHEAPGGGLVVRPAEAGTMTSERPVALLRGARPAQPIVQALLDRCAAAEARA
jgi:hypothetical protein